MLSYENEKAIIASIYMNLRFSIPNLWLTQKCKLFSIGLAYFREILQN